MPTVALGLGSNMGNRLLNLKNALRALKNIRRENGADKINALKILRASDVFETAPWGVTDQPSFLNACVLTECSLTPRELLSAVKEIETRLGRTATRRWGERVIDIDILTLDSLVFDEPDLRIPHPEMHRRDFVLIPLSTLLPDWVHPLTGQTVTAMAKSLSDSGAAGFQAVRICPL